MGMTKHFRPTTETLSFRSLSEFRKWLTVNHLKSRGIWLRIFKKDSERASITYSEALDEALCFGWIDARKERYDDSSWLQRFTPRRPKSGWSKINTQNAKTLLPAGRIHASGHAP